MTPLIHIGNYKTGTTWLQEEVFGRRNRGFWPVSPQGLPPVPSAKFAGYPAVVDARRKLLSPHDDGYGLDWRPLLDGRPPEAVPVVSNERLSGYFMASGLDSYSIARRLKTGFSDARILITVREQRDMILSSYLQYLKRGGVMPLARLLERKHDQRMAFFSSVYCEYHRPAETYRVLFGAENVLVLPFEMFRADPELYLSRVYAFAGAVRPAGWTPDFGQKNNETRGVAGLAASRFVSRLLQSNSLNAWSLSGRVSRKIGLASALESALCGVPRSLDRRVAASLKLRIAEAHPEGHFAESNRRLEPAFGSSLRDYGYD